MRAPVVGVSTSITVQESPERAYVNTAYLAAVRQAGGIPLLLPPGLDAEALRTLWERLGGLLLTGGGDVDPEHFAEPRHPATRAVSEARDRLELGLVRRALEDDVPVLAICRGLQVVNIALGGSLWQDIEDQLGSPIEHSQKEARGEPTHHVKVPGEGTRLGGILGALELRVNSMHHQAIKTLGAGLRPVAWAPDGIVEAAELEDRTRFLVGVQWHPEELVGRDPAARALFAALVDRARRRG